VIILHLAAVAIHLDSASATNVATDIESLDRISFGQSRLLMNFGDLNEFFSHFQATPFKII